MHVPIWHLPDQEPYPGNNFVLLTKALLTLVNREKARIHFLNRLKSAILLRPGPPLVLYIALPSLRHLWVGVPAPPLRFRSINACPDEDLVPQLWHLSGGLFYLQVAQPRAELRSGIRRWLRRAAQLPNATSGLPRPRV